MNLIKKREKNKLKDIKKVKRIVEKDVKFKYIRGDEFYSINNFSDSVHQLGDILIVDKIIENFLKKKKITYNKRVIKIDGIIKPNEDVIDKIYYEFEEIDWGDK